MTDAPPIPASDSLRPPQKPENDSSISSMVVSSASSAANAAANFARRGRAFGGDMTFAARTTVDTAHAYACSPAIAVSDAANAAMASTLTTVPSMTQAQRKR